MTPDLWWFLVAGLATGALTLLFACLQVAGAASDAADRALARSQLVGLHLPLHRPFHARATETGTNNR